MKTDTQKIVQIINSFATKEGGKINYTKVLKLIYLSDKYMLCKYGRMITNDRYSALKRGPIPSVTKDIARAVAENNVDDEDFPVSSQYSKKYIDGEGGEGWNIRSKENFDDELFSDAEIKAMEAVYEKFGGQNQWSLCELTHHFYEWKKHNIDGEANKHAPMRIVDFFVSSDNDELNEFFNLNKKDVELKKEFYLKLEGASCS